MNKFNLTFNGELLPGHSPERARQRFARLFSIADPARVEQFFSGQTVILRRNLARKEAAEYYQQMRRIGVVASLEKVVTQAPAANSAKSAARRGDAASPAASATTPVAAAAIGADAPQTKEPAPRRRRGRSRRQRADGDNAVTHAAAAAATADGPPSEEQAPRRRRGGRRGKRRAATTVPATPVVTATPTITIAPAISATPVVTATPVVAATPVITATPIVAATPAMAATSATPSVTADALEEARQRLATKLLGRPRATAAAPAPVSASAPASAATQPAAPRRPAPGATAATTCTPAVAAVATAAQRLRARDAVDIDPAPGRRTQPDAAAPAAGAPNLYRLQPFRNTPAVRARSSVAQQRARLALYAGLAALLVWAALLASRLASPAVPPLPGASAVAATTAGGPLLLAGDTLLTHDRAGVPAERIALSELGAGELRAPLLFTPAGDLLAVGRPASAAVDSPATLLRCELGARRCAPVSTEIADVDIAALALNPLTGDILLADAGAGAVLKLAADGRVLARAQRELPAAPVLRLQDGLLLVNSDTAPAVSVLRYDDEAFGQQLDELLVLPPADIDLEHSRVTDFLHAGGHWWVAMTDGGSGDTAVFRFDDQWNAAGPAVHAAHRATLRLIAWQDKVLLHDPAAVPLQRFAANGTPEAPFVSGALQELVSRQQREQRLTAAAWRIALAALALATLCALGLAALHRLRWLVYRPCRERGADPLDASPQAPSWLPFAANRGATLRRYAISYAMLSVALLLLAIGLAVSASQLAALLIALCGPAVALLLLARRGGGHVGVQGDRLLLVDHRQVYHLGSGSAVQRCGPLLAIDDVVVFTGNRWLPAFAPRARSDLLATVCGGSVKVDRVTAWIKLIESRHPLAQGAAAMLASALIAVAVCYLGG